MAAKLTSYVPKPGGSVKAIMKQMQKVHGESAVGFGGLIQADVRVPTGVFAFDLATGGGIPKGRCTIFYGPEDSAKTTMAYLAIRHHQQLWPNEVCVYIAVEPFDREWAKKCGVDADALLVLYPSYAEQCVDMARAILAGDDTGLVVLDSIAAMITTAEADKNASQSTMGGPGLVTGKLVRGTALSLRNAELQGRSPTLLYINQRRHKVGVMYGDPETMPGGNAPLFQAQLRARFASKPVVDDKISDSFAVRRELHFNLKKTKVPHYAMNGTAQLAVYPHDGLSIGETDDWKIVLDYLDKFSAVEKTTKGINVGGEMFPTQKAFRQKLYTDKAYGAYVRKQVIEAALAYKEDYVQPDYKAVVDEDGVITDMPSDDDIGEEPAV